MPQHALTDASLITSEIHVTSRKATTSPRYSLTLDSDQNSHRPTWQSDTRRGNRGPSGDAPPAGGRSTQPSRGGRSEGGLPAIKNDCTWESRRMSATL